MNWPQPITAQLGEMIDAGKSAGEAARSLRITRCAAVGRAHRLGWRFGTPRTPEQRVPPFLTLVRCARPKRLPPAPRPPVADRLIAMSCRLDPETHAEIVRRAGAGRTSRNAVIQELIEWSLDAWPLEARA